MARTIAFSLACWLTLAACGYGQYYEGPRGRMSPQEAGAIAEYWINSYFRRAAHPREIRSGAEQIIRSPSPAHALASLLSSREYYNYAGGTRTGFVRQLIEDVGHHEPSRYEIEDLLRETAGADPNRIAYVMLRRYPRNWWPGPAATPPRELRHLYD